MKKLYFLILLCSVLIANAQKEKKYILRTDFGYSYSHKDMLDAGSNNFGDNYFGEINSAFTTSIGAGRKLKSNFYYGLGVIYHSSKHEINPDADIPDFSGSPGYIQMQSYVHSLSTDKVISPYLFLQYFYNFTDWFSIAFDLYSKYDFYQNKTNAIFYMPFNSNGDFSYVKYSENNTETKKQILNIGLRPSLRFKLYKNFGLNFAFGILEYSLKINDSRDDELEKKTNAFKIGFSPNNWLLGIYLKL